jgi:hypothetical protein
LDVQKKVNKRNEKKIRFFVRVFFLISIPFFLCIEFDEDMQRELADDAPWKRIQQNTFTRWANEHLKLVNRNVNDLQLELSDGLSLVALIEVLSQKKLPRYNKRPNFRSQKLENVSVVLDYLENTERIRLVNIGKFNQRKRLQGQNLR